MPSGYGECRDLASKCRCFIVTGWHPSKQIVDFAGNSGTFSRPSDLYLEYIRSQHDPRRIANDVIHGRVRRRIGRQSDRSERRTHGTVPRAELTRRPDRTSYRSGRSTRRWIAAIRFSNSRRSTGRSLRSAIQSTRFYRPHDVDCIRDGQDHICVKGRIVAIGPGNQGLKSPTVIIDLLEAAGRTG